MTQITGNAQQLSLDTTSQSGCARITLAVAGTGPAAFPLVGLTPTMCGPLRNIDLVGDNLGALSESERHQLLRHCRHLLRPGGQLSVPVGRADSEFPRAGLGEAAWLCGFAAWVEFVAGHAVMTKPEPQPRATPTAQVSIVIPAYKVEHFSVALDSAQAQTWPNCDIVVCDDSPDGRIAEIAARSVGAHPVRHIRNPGNIGGRANYLQGYAVARGQYLKFLNDDDRLHPECVARMAAILDDHPAVTLVTSYRRLIDADDKPLPDTIWNSPLVLKDSLVDGRRLINQVLSEGTNRLGEPTTVMFRKADMAASQPHLMSYAGQSARRNGDMSIWTSLLSRGDAVVLAEAMSEFRVHVNQVQKDPVFHDEAVLAWTELQAAARRTGLMIDGSADSLAALEIEGRSDLACGEETFRAGGMSDAATIFRRRLWLDPTDSKARGNLACAYWEAGQQQLAVVECVLAHCCEPGDETIALNLQDMLAAEF